MAQTNDSICSLFRCAKLPFFFSPMMNFILCVCAHPAERENKANSSVDLSSSLTDFTLWRDISEGAPLDLIHTRTRFRVSAKYPNKIDCNERRDWDKFNNFIWYLRNLIFPSKSPNFPFCATVSLCIPFQPIRKWEKLSSLVPFHLLIPSTQRTTDRWCHLVTKSRNFYSQSKNRFFATSARMCRREFNLWVPIELFCSGNCSIYYISGSVYQTRIARDTSTKQRSA